MNPECVQTQPAPPPLVWHAVVCDNLRDATRRFAVWYAPRTGRWVAVDVHRDHVGYGPTLEAAQAWCEQQNAIGRAA